VQIRYLTSLIFILGCCSQSRCKENKQITYSNCQSLLTWCLIVIKYCIKKNWFPLCMWLRVKPGSLSEWHSVCLYMRVRRDRASVHLLLIVLVNKCFLEEEPPHIIFNWRWHIIHNWLDARKCDLNYAKTSLGAGWFGMLTFTCWQYTAKTRNQSN